MQELDLNKYDIDTIKLVVRQLSKTYGDYKITGKIVLFDKGTPKMSEVDELALKLVKSQAVIEINSRAENLRVQVIGNNGVGMLMVYLAKNDEAERAIIDENPNPADYPFLAVEIGYYGATIKDVATVVLTAKQQWGQAALYLEQLRRATHKQINDAVTVDAVNKILANTKFSIPGA